MDETQLDVDRILDQLCRSTGLTISRVGFRDAATDAELEFQLSEGRGTYPVKIQAKPHLRSSDIARLDHARDDGVYRLVVSDRVTPMIGDRLRELGYWFVDRSGNASLSGPGLCVDIRGKRESSRENRELARPRVQPQNLFTPRRSQVICMLLTHTSLARAPLREIAWMSGTSLAVTKGTVDLLVQSEFMETDGRDRWIVEPGLLLDSWASSFRLGLGRDLLLMKASGPDHGFSVPAEFSADISGERAVPELIRNPETLTVYLDEDERGRVPVPFRRENRWREDEHGGVTVRRRFWQYGRFGEGTGIAPLPLVYADLLDIDDPRLREVSAKVKEWVLYGVH